MKKTKAKVSFFTKIMLFLNGIAVLAMLLAYLAPVTDPRTLWPIAFFGLAYPPVLLLNLLFIAYWVIVRFKFAGFSLITILIGVNILLKNIGFHIGSRDDFNRSKSEMRVLTYNVHSFRNERYGEDDTTRHGILKVIKNINPDIVGIQEFFSRKRGRYAMSDSISNLLQTKYQHFEPNMQTDNEKMGMCIFSRYPIIAKGSVAISPPGMGNQCIYVDVKTNKKVMRFYSVHLQSIRFEAEDYRYIDTITKSGKADLASTRRLGGKLKRAFIKRAEQVLMVKEHAAQCPYPYIISGDFNDTPTSFAVNQMAKGIKNTFREKGFGFGRTYNGDFPNYQIDYIMVNNSFEVLNYKIIQQKLSDHYPVYADLVLQ